MSCYLPVQSLLIAGLSAVASVVSHGTLTAPLSPAELSRVERARASAATPRQCYNNVYSYLRQDPGPRYDRGLGWSPKRACQYAKLKCGAADLECGACGEQPLPAFYPGCNLQDVLRDAKFLHGMERIGGRTCGGSIHADKLAHCYMSCRAFACGGPAVWQAYSAYDRLRKTVGNRDHRDLHADELGKVCAQSGKSPWPLERRSADECLSCCTDATYPMQMQASPI